MFDKVKTLMTPATEEAAHQNESGQLHVVEELLPGSVPSARSSGDRTVELSIANPFIMGETVEHPRVSSVSDPLVFPKEVQLNGLVKFRMHFNDSNMPQQTKDVLARHQGAFGKSTTNQPGDVSYLPKNFGRGLNLDGMDMRLFKFCRMA